MSDLQHDSQASVALDDSGAGLAMFVIFTTAVLIVTGAVAIVALVNTWWILGVAFAIHVLMTTVVVAAIVSVMNGRASAATGRVPAESRRDETRPPTAIRPVTAV
jgi:membrane protein implicated in regulation of membrane protease activity